MYLVIMVLPIVYLILIKMDMMRIIAIQTTIVEK